MRREGVPERWACTLKTARSKLNIDAGLGEKVELGRTKVS
jgi:hypothetical protein